MLNRSALILKPKQPYLDWARLDDEHGLAVETVESMREDPTLYLVPEWDDPEQMDAVLESSWSALFEIMLADWSTLESQWPANRTRAMFDEWFDVQGCGLVVDLIREPLERLDLDDLDD